MEQSKPKLNTPLNPADYATSKYKWEDLKDIINKKTFPILRHINQETTYRLYSNQLKQEWKSVYDFVLHCKFDFERRLIPVERDSNSCDNSSSSNNNNNVIEEKKSTAIDDNVKEEENNNDNSDIKIDYIPTLPHIPKPPKGYVWEAVQSQSRTGSSTSQRIITMNDFPYYMDDHIEHWCLWKLGSEDVTENDISWAKHELSKRGDIREMMHWINPVHLKSLPDIYHAHIVCLLEKDTKL